MKNQTFGIEIEMNRISRAKAAATIAAHFGTSVDYVGRGRAYDTREVRDQQGRIWKVVSDSSIDGPSDEKTELVSPICRWEDIETVQELVRKLRAAGANPDPSCGIHIHIGLGAHTPKTLRNLANLVASKEELLIASLGVRETRLDHYTKRTDPRFIQLLNQKRPTSMEAFAQLWYRDNDWQRHASDHYDGSRYRTLNLHSVWQKGTIEFRLFNSTLHAGEIKTYIQLAMAISHQALESNSASPRQTPTDNPKYTFRCWLLRLGFIGDEFATARHHLLKNLKGDAAFRHGRP